MGTRNLTMVVADGKTRIAQYGQWDGYPSGQGVKALDFLLKADLDAFKTKVLKCRWFSAYKKRELKKFMESIGSKDGWVTMEQAAKYNQKYPMLGRDNGAEILNLVNNSTDKVIWLHDESGFAADSLFCEWAYVIDLDKRTFEVYKGFNKTELEPDQRFAYLKKEEDNEYYPVRMIKSYSLDELPTPEQFIKELEAVEETEPV